MTFGKGEFVYEVEENWLKIPAGMNVGWIAGIALDSRDRVYVYSRSEEPIMVFGRDGNYLTSWGKGILEDAHGIFIDAFDNVFCTDRLTHCVRKFTTDGELLLTLGNPKQKGAPGDPFNRPTDVGLGPDGKIYVTDGYSNSRVHKYTSEGQLIKSWGTPGAGPGEFVIPHCVRYDSRDRLLVADRENNRIQIFTPDGEYIGEWTGFHRPDTIYIDKHDTVYIAELDQRVTILDLDGKILAQWGCERYSEIPGEFFACPHGIWTDSKGDLYVSEVQADARLQKYNRK